MRGSSSSIPAAKNILADFLPEGRNAEEDEQVQWMAEYLSSQPKIVEETNNDSIRLQAIALFLEHWELVGPTPPVSKYMRAIFAFDTLKMLLDISFNQAELLTPSQIRERILIELRMVKNHFLGYDKLAVAKIGKGRGAAAAIFAVDDIFRIGAEMFAEKLRRLAAELEVAVLVSGPESQVKTVLAGDERCTSVDEGVAIQRSSASIDPNAGPVISTAGVGQLNVGKKKRKTRVSADIRHVLIISVLEQHHRVGENGQVHNQTPLQNSEIYERLEKKVATGSITKWMKTHFGENGQLGYEAACNGGRFGPKFLTIKDEYYHRERDDGGDKDDE